MESLQQHILERELDMCAITETWIKSSDEKKDMKEIPPLGYSTYIQGNQVNKGEA